MDYIQNTDDDRKEMLKAMGASSFEELLEPIDESIRLKEPLKLGKGLSEQELVETISELAEKNKPASSLANFLGGGVYDHYIPAVVRYVLSRSEFYTSYTPYQAEVSQGTLQAIYEYQSLICRITEMDVANASMYDGATALAEAVLMSCGIKRKGTVLIPKALSPSAKSVIRGYCNGRGIEVREVEFTSQGTMDLDALKGALGDDVAGVVLANPNYFGLIEPVDEISSLVHEAGALLIACVEPVSLSVLSPPGRYDADIVVGEGQPLGNPMNFGGPLLGFMATKKEFVRRMPGRLISATVDVDGRRGYVMTLQTREQHIRREKATSNICTNEGLCALAAAVYLATLGETGFRELGIQCLSKSHTLYRMLGDIDGVKLPFGENFFQEFVIDVSGSSNDVLMKMRQKGVLGGIRLGDDFPELGRGAILVAVTEKRKLKELELFRSALESALKG